VLLLLAGGGGAERRLGTVSLLAWMVADLEARAGWGLADASAPGPSCGVRGLSMTPGTMQQKTQLFVCWLRRGTGWQRITQRWSGGTACVGMLR